jgi:hypothetical protein
MVIPRIGDEVIEAISVQDNLCLRADPNPVAINRLSDFTSINVDANLSAGSSQLIVAATPAVTHIV